MKRIKAPLFRAAHKVGVTVGVAALLLLSSLPAAAAISVDVNGKPLQFGNAQPIKIGGSVLIPLRAVVENLGAEIHWDGSTQTVSGSKGAREFSLRIGSRDARVNNNPVTLNQPAQLINGNTMVPLRFVAEALGGRGVERRRPARRH